MPSYCFMVGRNLYGSSALKLRSPRLKAHWQNRSFALLLSEIASFYFFFCALIFAQRAFCAAAILARPAELMCPLFFFSSGEGVFACAAAEACPFTFAHLRRWAAAMRLRASGDIRRGPRPPTRCAGNDDPPSSAAIAESSRPRCDLSC